MRPRLIGGAVFHSCNRQDLSYVQFALGFELFNRSVAFAGSIFQVLAVQDSHRSTSVLDKLGLLQDPSRNANARASRPEHAPQKFMRKRQRLRTNPVVA